MCREILVLLEHRSFTYDTMFNTGSRVLETQVACGVFRGLVWASLRRRDLCGSPKGSGGQEITQKFWWGEGKTKGTKVRICRVCLDSSSWESSGAVGIGDET